MDHSWFDSSRYPDIKFRGRPRSSIRFGAGDIVEVLRGNEVHLAVATQSPIDIDWCWDLRERIARRLKESGEDVTDEILEKEYFVDDTDDQAAVVDGPGYEYHEHFPTQCIMPLRFRLSERLRKRFDGCWQACLKQDEEYRKGN